MSYGVYFVDIFEKIDQISLELHCSSLQQTPRCPDTMTYTVIFLYGPQ